MGLNIYVGDSKRGLPSWDSTLFGVDNRATHEHVADQLRTSILLGRFLAGQRLPTERNLAAQLGVSRNTIRKAIRTLEEEGLIRTLRGATGGNFVTEWRAASEDNKSNTGIVPEEITAIFEYRMAIECTCARLAAVKRKKKDLKKLRTLLNRMTKIAEKKENREDQEKLSEFFTDDNLFHLLIGELSGNRYLLTATELSRAEMFRPIGRVFHVLSEQANDFHLELYSAIERSDPDTAEQAMRSHVLSTYMVTMELAGIGNRVHCKEFSRTFE